MDTGIIVVAALGLAIVCAALGFLGWGIVKERRDRTDPEQAREVMGEPAATFEVSREGDTPAAR